MDMQLQIYELQHDIDGCDDGYEVLKSCIKNQNDTIEKIIKIQQMQDAKNIE